MIHRQPRRYRIRLHNQHGEVGIRQQPMVVLDLTPGSGLDEAEGKLRGQWRALVRQVADHNEEIGDYYLAVYDWDTDAHQFDWYAR